MKFQFIFAMLAIALLLSGCATTSPPTTVDTRLTVPESPTEREYLGITNRTEKFLLAEVSCDVLIIDCFDMYCHICQASAGHINELYRLVQERGLGPRVKFVGLGLGDTPLEVTTYKEKFKVPFPVFPDRRSAVAKQYGPIKLPNLLVLRKQGAQLQVVNSSPGVLLSPSEVLSHIQAALRQEQSYYWNDPAQARQPTCDSASGVCRNPCNSSRNGSAKALIAN